MLTYYEKMVEFEKEAKPFVQVILIDSVGSVPQKIGAKMLVTNEGLQSGTIGGGSIEWKAIEWAQSVLKQALPSQMLSWDLEKDTGMSCGGQVKLFFEVHCIKKWDIAIFGAGHVAQCLVPLLLNLDSFITVFDKRQEWLDKLPTSSRLKSVRVDCFKEAVSQLSDSSFVVVMTPNHEFDFDILYQSLQFKNFFYLGVMGSTRKAASFKKQLIENGVENKKLESYFCPIGFSIGTNDVFEISISILAQLIEQRDAHSTGDELKL